MKQLDYKNLILLSFFLCYFISCNKSFKKNPNLQILGHSGLDNSTKYPPNSLHSIQEVFLYGANGVEIDIQLTKDKILVAYHDEFLSKKYALKDRIIDYSLSELRQNSYRKKQWKNFKIETLENIFSFIKNKLSFLISLDCKLFPKDDVITYVSNFAKVVIQLIKKHGISNQILIEAPTNISFLKQMKEVGLSVFVYVTNFNEGLSIATELNLSE